ncbi:MAG TPA: hypothetical protein VK932_22785, partial [Kofleriaceae bacterium]|nr:hypothetical protein [Kofleriaceae bacterium]
MATRRERRILAATAALAVGVPAGAAAWVHAAGDALAARLSEAGGVPARIGAIDADLTGAIRITGVALGDLASADAIEASVAMGSLLGGRLRADELRIDGPRIAVRVDPDGGSDLARLARRLARLARLGGSGEDGSGADRSPGLGRVLVTRGALTARVAGLGELVAEEVELVPDAGGVRVVTGQVRLRAGLRAVELELAFTRAAAEIALPELRLGRVLAVGGAGTLAGGARGAGTGTEAGAAVALRDVAVGRLAPGGPLELRAGAA